MPSTLPLYSGSSHIRKTVSTAELAVETLKLGEPLYLDMRNAGKEDQRLIAEKLGCGAFVPQDIAENRSPLYPEEPRKNRQTVFIMLPNTEVLQVPGRLLTHYSYEDQGVYPLGYRPT